MKRIIAISLLSFILTHAFAQKETKVSTCFFTEYNQTIYDRTIVITPGALGWGC